MTRQPRIRLAGAVLALAVCATALTACTFGPDPAEVRSETREVFDDLVGVLSDADPAILRTVETAPESEQACGEDGEGTQHALVATGTLPVTAPVDAVDAQVDALGAELDPETWDRIRSASDAPEQQAWASEDGIVVTVTFDDPVLVTAVFTPCTR